MKTTLLPAEAAALVALLYGGSSPTGSAGADSFYRFAVVFVFSVGLTRSPFWLRILAPVILVLWSASSWSLACGIAAIALTIGQQVLAQREVDVEAETDPPISRKKNALQRVTAFVMSLASPLTAVMVIDLQDQSFRFSSAAVVVVLTTVASISLYVWLPKMVKIWVFVAGFVVCTAFGFATASYGLQANERLTSLEEAVSLAREDPEQLDIAKLHSDISESNSALNEWWYEPLEYVPVLSQNVSVVNVALADSTAAASSVAQLLEPVDPENALSSGLNISDAIANSDQHLQQLCVNLEQLQTSVDDNSKKQYLLPQVRQAMKTASVRLTSLDSALEACPSFSHVSELAGYEKSKTYLVLFMTTSETRGIGGLITNWATVSMDEGDVTLVDSGRSIPMNERLKEVGATIDYSPEMANLWGKYSFEKHFQDIGATPNGEYLAEVATDLYAQAYPDENIDGVIALGPKGLASLVSMQGTVEIQGQELSSDNTVDFLTRDQYTLDLTYSERVSMLDELLRVAVKTPDTRVSSWERTDFELVMEAVRSGELLFVPEDQEQRQNISDLGLTGALPPQDGRQLLGIIEQNAGLDKLDAYLDRDAHLVWQDAEDTNPTLTLNYTNNASPSLPEYVLGYSDTAPGTNRLRIAPYAPVAASKVTARSNVETQFWEKDPYYATENGHQVSMILADIPSEGSLEVIYEFSGWPAPVEEMEVLKPPSVRDRSIDISIGQKTWTSDATSRLSTIEVNK